MASLGLRGAEDDPEAEEAAALRGDVLLALRRAAIERAVVPAPAPQAAERGGVLGRLPVFVGAPLGDVPVHVEEAPGVGALLRDELRASRGVDRVPAEQVELALVVAERPARRRPGAAGVLPFRLGRQGQPAAL